MTEKVLTRHYKIKVSYSFYYSQFMPHSASELTYYFNVIKIIYASFGIRINLLL